ncbi:CBS domain-containing protein [Antrihabitans sp. YC2-6]|uniref:CBS domain-containing protein n=1 Tax=Antrihabitans sp. YC2-6 TaxID=2799498 RepID=UPI0018F5D571|nr:CBS domain-containing protein [Antrihabitans sp. YC2-6]MBJ8347092.1 CBS domain-containing protein [Antrihabitans sp. YC2-6]
MSRPAVLVESREELASIVDVMLHTGFTTLPVVDADGRLVKLITEDSVAQAHLVHLLADKLLRDNGVDAAAEPSSVFDFALAPASVELDSTLTEIIEAMLRMGLPAFSAT